MFQRMNGIASAVYLVISGLCSSYVLEVEVSVRVFPLWITSYRNGRRRARRLYGLD